MSLVATPPASLVGKFLRSWFPILVFVLAALGVTASWIMPVPNDMQVMRIFGTVVAGGLGVIFLLIWFFFFSGLAGGIRLIGLLILVALVGGFLAAVKVEETRFGGDMLPIFAFRWDKPHDQLLAEHRQSQGDGKDLPAIDLATGTDTNFPQYRGKDRAGIIRGPELARDWEKDPPKLLWKQPVGAGHSGFAVAGNIAITLEQRGAKEMVVCYDTATGKERWAHGYDAKFYEAMGGVGPRSTPTIVGEEVFTLGATGKLLCLEVKTGREKWSADTLENEENVTWGLSGSPLVFDNVVVVNPGKQKPEGEGNTLVAYDRTTGSKIWASGTAPAGYSSPMLATLADKRHILLFDGKGLSGYDADKGTELWRVPWEANQDINVAQPLLLSDNRVFITSGYGVGCAMIQISQKEGKWSAETLWKKNTLRCKFSSPIYHDGFIYGLDEGTLVCINAKNGKRKWRAEDRYDHGQILLTNGLIVVMGEWGDLVLVEVNPEEFRQLGRVQVLGSQDNRPRTWNPYALANGKVFVRNDREMACYDLRAEKSEKK